MFYSRQIVFDHSLSTFVGELPYLLREMGFVLLSKLAIAPPDFINLHAVNPPIGILPAFHESSPIVPALFSTRGDPPATQPVGDSSITIGGELAVFDFSPELIEHSHELNAVILSPWN